MQAGVRKRCMRATGEWWEDVNAPLTSWKAMVMVLCDLVACWLLLLVCCCAPCGSVMLQCGLSKHEGLWLLALLVSKCSCGGLKKCREHCWCLPRTAMLVGFGAKGFTLGACMVWPRVSSLKCSKIKSVVFIGWHWGGIDCVGADVMWCHHRCSCQSMVHKWLCCWCLLVGVEVASLDVGDVAVISIIFSQWCSLELCSSLRLHLPMKLVRGFGDGAGVLCLVGVGADHPWSQCGVASGGILSWDQELHHCWLAMVRYQRCIVGRWCRPPFLCKTRT